MGLPDERNLLQPNGVHMSEIAKSTSCDLGDPVKLIYVGHLTKSKGIHLIIEAIHQLKTLANFKFDIYGDGPFLENIKTLIHKYQLHNHVKIMGKKGHREVLLKYSEYDIGVALYTRDDSFNYYCDPVKVKEYLAAGLGTVISDVPYIADIIHKNKLGYKTSNSIEDIKHVLNLASDKKNVLEIKENVRNFKIDLDWNNLFDRNYERIAITI
ncbi:MAG: glycosyltransferase [Candidatus Aceula meridiana]|nr:glycosyltransferase [Candidatus Aceula meridiana]